MRAASLGIAFSILLFISACSHTLNIDSVTGSSERLFVGTRDGAVRVFDLSNHRLVDSIEIPEKIEDKYFHRRISALLEDHGRVLVQASTTSRPLQKHVQSTVYLIEGKRITKLGTLPPQNIMVGVDSESIYGVENKETLLEGYRYDKGMRERRKCHFDEYPELVIADMCECKDSYWYACVGSPSGSHRLGGKLFLVSREKGSGNLSLFEIESDSFWYETIGLTGDGDSIWIFGTDLKEDGRIERNIQRFSRIHGTITESVNASDYQLVKMRETERNSQFLWLLQRRDDHLCRLDKETLKVEPLDVRVPGERTRMEEKRPLFADSENLWLAVLVYDKKSEQNVPYLLRVSAKNMDHELISLDPGYRQVLAKIETGFRTGMLPLTVVILFLSFGVLVTVFGLLNVRKMRGRAITAAAEVITIIPPIFAFSLQHWLMDAGLLPVPVLFGLTSVLFSRTLVFLVKPLKKWGVSWPLTIVFSLLSPALFELLLFATYRFPMGERGLGMLYFSFYGGITTGIVSFVVNIWEKSRGVTK
jgi:hypothetical protein